MTVMPVSRVFGAKARVAHEIIALIPAGKRVYVEAFAGSAAVLLQKPPHLCEHINDMDGDVVNLFRCLQSPEKLLQLSWLVSVTPFSQAEFEDAQTAAMLGQGPKPEDCEPDVEQAWDYLIRSWQGVAGDDPAGTTGWRYDKTANKVVARQWADLPLRLSRAALRLKQVHVHQKPALEIIKRFADDPNTVIFVDPPYPHDSINTHGKSAYRVNMTHLEHLEVLAALCARKASIIVTMSQGTVYDEILDGWYTANLTVKGLRNADKAERVFCNFRPDGPLFHI